MARRDNAINSTHFPTVPCKTCELDDGAVPESAIVAVLRSATNRQCANGRAWHFVVRTFDEPYPVNNTRGLVRTSDNFNALHYFKYQCIDCSAVFYVASALNHFDGMAQFRWQNAHTETQVCVRVERTSEYFGTNIPDWFVCPESRYAEVQELAKFGAFGGREPINEKKVQRDLLHQNRAESTIKTRDENCATVE